VSVTISVRIDDEVKREIEENFIKGATITIENEFCNNMGDDDG